VVDRATVIGLITLLALLGWVMLTGAGWAAGVFWQTPSIMFVIGGAVVAAMVGAPNVGPRRLLAILRNAFVAARHSPEETIITLVALAEVARRDGLLALESPVKGLRDDFTRRAMQMAIDGTDREVIIAVSQAELESIEMRHAEGKAVLELMARFAPAFGMMGTLIGLVAMLGRMDDPGRIGPGMAVAMLTTLYGLATANLFCLPVARRLAYRSSQELLAKTISLKGVLGIQAGDNPRVLAQRLRAYLPGAGRGQEFAWAPVSRRAAERPVAERREAAPAARTDAAAAAPQSLPAQPAIDEKTARKMAEQLEKIVKGQKRFVDAA
jgi:chemotaxis protein MotA